MNNLSEILSALEAKTGYTNLRISARHDGNGWVVYRRYQDNNNQWQSLFVASINTRGEVRVQRVNHRLIGIADTSILPAPKATQPSDVQANEPAVDDNPLK